jgi:hypothetical protein
MQMQYTLSSEAAGKEPAASGCVSVHAESIADSYFFNEISSKMGEGQAMAWLLEDRKRRERSTSMSTSGSTSPRSSHSAYVTSKTFVSCTEYGERVLHKVSPCLRHVVSRPLADSVDNSTHGSSTADAAMVGTSSACPSKFVSVADATGDDGEVWNCEVLKMGANAGLLYTDAAHIVLEKTTEAPKTSFIASSV